MRILFFIAAWLSAVLLILPPMLYRWVSSDELPQSSAGTQTGCVDIVDMQSEDSQNPPSETLTAEPRPSQTQQTQTEAAEETLAEPVLTAPTKQAQTVPESQKLTKKPDTPAAADSRDSRVLLHITGESGMYTVTLREYLIGVVMAEMPSYFHEEALRAQAVAARSYLLYRRDQGYAIYDYGSSCTAHFTEEEGRAFFGDAYDAVLEKVTSVVDDTDGEVLFYQDKIVCAAYHAMSYRRTADGAEVWGGDTPYLISVPTPEGEALSGIMTEYSFSETELCRLLNVEKALPFQFAQTSSGRAASVAAASGEVFSAERFRALLRLRSTAISVADQGADSITVRVWGFGHGVGMSQYGADIYADSGWSYKDILSHYYPQTSLGLIT